MAVLTHPASAAVKTRCRFMIPWWANEDLSGRYYLDFKGEFPADHVGDLPTDMIEHVFRSLAENLQANLHIAVEGENAHHMVEACFKGFARALRQAIRQDGAELPSTKGVL